MKILKLYNDLLTETKIESCVNNFGYELFGNQLGGKETNTDLENSYIKTISDFTDTKYGEQITPEFIKTVNKLKTCINQYPEVLIPEKTKVYRGLNIALSDIIKQNQIINLKNTIPYIYKSKYKIESWTTNYDIAATFGNHDKLNEIAKDINFNDYKSSEKRQELLKQLLSSNLKIAFILSYDSNQEEFMFKSKYFKKLSMANHEDEIIRFSNKPIKVEAKFNDHEDVFLTYNGMLLIKYINLAIENK